MHGSGRAAGPGGGHSLCLGSAALLRCAASRAWRRAAGAPGRRPGVAGHLRPGRDHPARCRRARAPCAPWACGCSCCRATACAMWQRLAWRGTSTMRVGDRTPEDKLAHVRACRRAAIAWPWWVTASTTHRCWPAPTCPSRWASAAPMAQSRADVVVPGGQLAAVAALVLHAQRTRVVVRQNLPGRRATTRCACRWPWLG
jgi:hypothetical protein